MMRRLYLPWSLALPLIVLGTLTSLALIEQLLSGWAFHRAINRLIAAGQPINDSDLQTRFFNSTSHEQTADRIEWRAAYHVTRAMPSFAKLWPVDNYYLNFMGQGLVPAGADWPDRALFEFYVAENRNALYQLEKLANEAKPTWQLMTLIGGANYEPFAWHTSELSLLDAEFLTAYHTGDSERALKSLEILNSVIVARDWQLSINEELYRLLAQNHLLNRVIQSLEHSGFWSEPQLIRLQKLLEPRSSLADRWRSVLTGERAMRLAMIDDQVSWFYVTVPANAGTWPDSNSIWISNSTCYRSLEVINQFVDLGNGGYKGLASRALAATPHNASKLNGWIPLQRLSDHHPTQKQWMTNFLPRASTYAQFLVDAENVRRLAMTAIALRRYASDHGKWPQHATDLSKYVVSQEDLQDVEAAYWALQSESSQNMLIHYSLHVQPPVVVAVKLGS